MPVFIQHKAAFFFFGKDLMLVTLSNDKDPCHHFIKQNNGTLLGRALVKLSALRNFGTVQSTRGFALCASDYSKVTIGWIILTKAL